MKRPICWVVRKLVPENIRDYLYICIDEPRPIPDFYPEARSLNIVKEHIAPIESDEKVRELLSFCEGLYDEEESRRQLVENKATILAGFSGTATAAVLAFLGGLLASDQFARNPLSLKIGISCACVFILLCLIISTVSALRGVAIKAYHYTNPKRIFDLGDTSLLDVLKGVSKIMCKQSSPC